MELTRGGISMPSSQLIYNLHKTNQSWQTLTFLKNAQNALELVDSSITNTVTSSYSGLMTCTYPYGI